MVVTHEDEDVDEDEDGDESPPVFVLFLQAMHIDQLGRNHQIVQ